MSMWRPSSPSCEQQPQPDMEEMAQLHASQAQAVSHSALPSTPMRMGLELSAKGKLAGRS